MEVVIAWKDKRQKNLNSELQSHNFKIAVFRFLIEYEMPKPYKSETGICKSQ